jgi:hypothetical protein
VGAVAPSMRSETLPPPSPREGHAQYTKKKTPTYEVGAKAGIYEIHDKDPWSKRRSKNHGKESIHKN